MVVTPAFFRLEIEKIEEFATEVNFLAIKIWANENNAFTLQPHTNF